MNAASRKGLSKTYNMDKIFPENGQEMPDPITKIELFWKFPNSHFDVIPLSINQQGLTIYKVINKSSGNFFFAKVQPK